MSSIFDDTFGGKDTNANKTKNLNPFDVLPAATDPFGISLNMKLSESSEKFDDNPFMTNTQKEIPTQPRSGKAALSSSNWLAYQHSMDGGNLDAFDDAEDKLLTTKSHATNRMNPFLNEAMTSSTGQTHGQEIPMPLRDPVFGVDFDFNKLPSVTSDNKMGDLKKSQILDDIFGINPITHVSGTIEKEHHILDIFTSPLSTLSAETTHGHTPANTPTPDFSHLTITTTSSTIPNATSDDQYLDWLADTSTLVSNMNSKSNTTNTIQNVNDLVEKNNFQSTSKLQNTFQENTSSTGIYPPTIRRPSNEDTASNSSHQSNSKPFDTSNASQDLFGHRSKNKTGEDSDDDTKMMFKIQDKKQAQSYNTNAAVPLLPPPPPPPSSSPSKTHKKTTNDGDSSSSEAEQADDDDPFAIFQTKSTKVHQQPEQDFFAGWNENESKTTEQTGESQKETVQTQSLDYYLHEPDFDDSAPLEPYHNDIAELQLQQLNGWLLQIRVPLRQKDLYRNTFQRFSETRNWQECYVRIFADEKKLRFYLPQTIEQSFAEISLETWYQCTKLSLQQLDQYTKIHTFKIFEANYHEIPQVRLDRLVTLPEKLLRKFTRPNKAQQVLLDHSNCVQQEIVKFGQTNYTYLKQFSIILEDLFWSMPVSRTRIQKHLKEEITVKIIDEYYAHIDIYRHICKHKSRTRLFILAFLNDTQPIVEIGMNDWFRHGKEVNRRNEIIINKTLQEYWIKPEQVELASIIDSTEYESTHLLKLIPPDSHYIEIMRFRTRPKQNIELPLQVYCFMSVIDRQVNIRVEVTVSNAFNISMLSKASAVVTNDKTASVRDDNSDEQCPCEDIQIRFPIPDAWVYMFRVEKRFRYGAIHSVRLKAGKIKGLDRFMVHRNDGLAPFMAASTGIAKYEQAFRSIVWRIDQLPKRDQGAYKTHLFECKISIPSYDPMPEKYEPIANVEYSMSQAFVSHCQIRSVAVPTAEETPEKWIRPKSRFTYTIDVEYAFKEDEKKDFAPIEIDMKEQPMTQSETENNSQSDSD